MSDRSFADIKAEILSSWDLADQVKDEDPERAHELDVHADELLVEAEKLLNL